MYPNKVIVLGLDGATFDLLDPWMKSGSLPNLNRLSENGVRGNLKSSLPFNSAVAWSSFITGMNPGKHGIYNFFSRSGENYDLQFVNARQRRGRSFWKIASEAGHKVGVVNVPVTYPTEEVNGFLISGMMAPDVNESIFYPRSLFGEIKKNVGMFPLRIYARDYIRANRYADLEEALIQSVRQHIVLFNYLIENKSWDMLCLMFSETDIVQHYFWRYIDPEHPLYSVEGASQFGSSILNVYKEINDYIGKLLDTFGEKATFILLSDHGHGPNLYKAIYLNNWLAKEGFLKFKDARMTSGKANPSLSKFLIAAGKRYIPRKYKAKLRGIPWLRSKVETAYRDPGIDWSQTVAYSDDQEGIIRINLKGREACGTVNPGSEYEEIKKRIKERVAHLIDPKTSENIFSDILDGSEVYWGPLLERAPDLLLLQNGKKFTYAHRISGPAQHRQPVKSFIQEEHLRDPFTDSSHRPYGILMMGGIGVRKGKILQNPDITDLAPTILALLDVPIPEEIDGKVLSESFTEDYLQRMNIHYSKSDLTQQTGDNTADYSEEDREEIEKHLRSLGYID